MTVAPSHADVQAALLAWYAANKRALPWRDCGDPYLVLVSEIMLQQTGVERVRPKFEEFVRFYPTLDALAAAPVGDVLRLWAGLGYNRRAVLLHRLAQEVVAKHNGRIPDDAATLRTLPGLGDYTVGAILSFAYNKDVSAVDTNVRRVLGRIFFGDDAPETRALRTLADSLVPPGQANDWNQALMDFGSYICTGRKPACMICPLAEICRARPHVQNTIAEKRATYQAQPIEKFVGSNRWYRGRVLAVLRELPQGAALPPAEVGARIKDDWQGDGEELAWLDTLLAGLARDGLIHYAPGEVGFI